MSRVLALLLLVAMVGTSAPVAPSGAAPVDACVVIDTDVDIDDVMAIPAVVGARHVAAVVTTEGFTLPGPGAATVEGLLADPGQRRIPVIVGAGIGRDESDIARTFGEFVLVFRALMNRLNNFWTAPPPPVPGTARYVDRIVDATAGCRTVDVLLIGGYTSFVEYSPAIRDRIGRVLITGRPPHGDPELEVAAESFNCLYDHLSCERVFYGQLPGLDHSFVDVPRTGCDLTPNDSGCAGTVYGPTLAMVRALGPAGLSDTLKRVLLNHPNSWAIDTWEHSGYGGRSLFWDQSTALALLDPALFAPVGAHLETTLSPEDFQRKWVEFTDLSAVYA